MGVPVQVINPNPKLRKFKPDLLEKTSHKMNPKSDSFKQIQIEEKMNADVSTSENSPTNISKAVDLLENGIWSQVNSNNIIEPLLIDVKPKRKTFNNEEDKKKFIEGFTQKKKTELCKNWELNGSCRYGDSCSFAHGKNELKSKTHLNSNYKQKPCKQFLLKGICFYGSRCQYLHTEIKYYPEHKDFLIKNQKKTDAPLKSLLNYVSEASVLKKMEKAYEKVKDAEKFLLNHKRKGEQRRLPVFSALTD